MKANNPRNHFLRFPSLPEFTLCYTPMQWRMLSINDLIARAKHPEFVQIYCKISACPCSLNNMYHYPPLQRGLH